VSLADCQNISNSGVKTLLHGAVTARSLQSLDVSRCAKLTGAAFSDLHVKVSSCMRCTPHWACCPRGDSIGVLMLYGLHNHGI